MSGPAITLLADESGTPFGGTPTWTDRTDRLLTSGDGEPIIITWGGQDEQSEPQPSQFSLVLDNSDGLFTPKNTNVFPETFPSSWPAQSGWDTGTPVRVRVTEGGLTYDRVTGFVDSIESRYGGPAWSTVSVSCSDVSARLARTAPLRSMVEQEILARHPTYLYPLSEPSGVESVGDISSNSQPAGSFLLGSPAGSVQLGQDALLPDPTTGASFGDAGSGAAVISLPVMPPTSGDFTLFYAITTPEAPPASKGYFCFISDQNLTAPSRLVGYVHTDGTIKVEISDPDAGTITLTSAASVCDGGPHTIGIQAYNGNRLSWRLVVDGTFTSYTHTAPLRLDRVTTNQVGGVVAKGLLGQFPGVVSKVALFPTALSPFPPSGALWLLDRFARGQKAERADLRFARIASYAGLTTSGLPVASATLRHQSTAGKNITEALAEVARTEGGVSYVTGSGALTFTSRSARYNAPVGLTLTAADVGPDTTTRRDRQGMMNELTVTRAGGASQRVVDETAQATYGILDGGSFDVASSTDSDAKHAAEWRVQTRKNPRDRLPSCVIDLLTQGSTFRQSVLAAGIGTLMRLTGLPSQAPASTFDGFVEGATETIGVDAWSVSVFTSPSLPPVLVLDDTSLGVLDSSNVVGF